MVTQYLALIIMIGIGGVQLTLIASDEYDGNDSDISIKELFHGIEKELYSCHNKIKDLAHQVSYIMHYSDLYALPALTWVARETHIVQSYAQHATYFGTQCATALGTVPTVGGALQMAAQVTGFVAKHTIATLTPWAGCITLGVLCCKFGYDLWQTCRKEPSDIKKFSTLTTTATTNALAFGRSLYKVATVATMFGYAGMLAQQQS